VSASTASAALTDKLPPWTATPATEGAAAAAGESAAASVASALQGLGLGANPWAKLHVGVARPKPHNVADPALRALMAAQVRARGAGAPGAAPAPFPPAALPLPPLPPPPPAAPRLQHTSHAPSHAPNPKPPPKRARPSQERDGKLRLSHFRRVKQLGAGDVGLVDLVQLQGSGLRFAMKTLDKWEMAERNKVGGAFAEVPGAAATGRWEWRPRLGLPAHFPARPPAAPPAAARPLFPPAPINPKVARVLTEEGILSAVDHPFLATLYCTLQVGRLGRAGTPTMAAPSPRLALLEPPCRASRPSPLTSTPPPHPTPLPRRGRPTATSTLLWSTVRAASCTACSTRSPRSGSRRRTSGGRHRRAARGAGGAGTRDGDGAAAGAKHHLCG
jgi:hypothetical protein